MADEYKRINLLIGTQADLAVGQEEGMPGIVSDNAYRFGVYAAGAWRLMALRDTSERFSALTVSNLTSGKIPLAGAGGIMGDSSLSEDAVSVKSAKPLTLNNSFRQPWGTSFAKTNQIGASACIGENNFGAGSVLRLSVNWFNDGANSRAFESRTGSAYPAWFALNDRGGIDLATSLMNPTSGGTISDMALRWSVDRFGRMKQWDAAEPVQSAQYVKTTTTTVTGTTTETSVINGGVAAGGWNAITVPAGRLNIAALLSDLKLKGAISSSGSTLVTWRVRVNGAVAATSAVTRNWGTSFWRIEGDGTTRTTGATGTRQWDIGLYANADNANAAVSYYDLSWLGTLDLTAVVTLDVTVQFAATTTSVSCTTAFLKHS